MATASVQFFSHPPLTEMACRWRLLAGNRRDLGRSIDAFEDLDAARAHILALQVRSGDVEPIVFSDSADGRWRWHLQLDSAVIALSSRNYSRRIECQAAADHFVALLPVARIAKNYAPVIPATRPALAARRSLATGYRLPAMATGGLQRSSG